VPGVIVKPVNVRSLAPSAIVALFVKVPTAKVIGLFIESGEELLTNEVLVHDPDPAILVLEHWNVATDIEPLFVSVPPEAKIEAPSAPLSVPLTVTVELALRLSEPATWSVAPALTVIGPARIPLGVVTPLNTVNRKGYGPSERKATVPCVRIAPPPMTAGGARNVEPVKVRVLPFRFSVWPPKKPLKLPIASVRSLAKSNPLFQPAGKVKLVLVHVPVPARMTVEEPSSLIRIVATDTAPLLVTVPPGISHWPGPCKDPAIVMVNPLVNTTPPGTVSVEPAETVRAVPEAVLLSSVTPEVLLMVKVPVELGRPLPVFWAAPPL
jgi:hypothetical protein